MVFKNVLAVELRERDARVSVKFGGFLGERGARVDAHGVSGMVGWMLIEGWMDGC